MNTFMFEAVSILVITRDRRDLLSLVLKDLRNQNYQGVFEIVVVEETDAPLAPEGVVYVAHPMKNLGIAYARNMSVQHAKQDILAFIDDDCRVSPDWLTSLVAPLEDVQVLGLQGGVTVPEGTNGIGWAETLLGFPGGGFTRVFKAQGATQNTQEVSTLNACYRKQAVLDAGCFSSEARFGGEDYLLAKKVAEEGKLLYVPNALVKHEARGSFAAIWTWFVRRGRAEFDLWQSGHVPEKFGTWMIRSSLFLKLLPFVILLYWSVFPICAFLALMIGMSLWRFRWAFNVDEVPKISWLLLPFVRMTMGLATDVGRFRAWFYKK